MFLVLMFADSQEKKDLSSAKERVKEALKREQEDRYGPRKRRFSLFFTVVDWDRGSASGQFDNSKLQESSRWG